jgi:predicted protein tyrosine phosphatase
VIYKSGEMNCSKIEPHELFNLMGMRKPLAFLDYRDKIDFEGIRIARSHSVKTSMVDVESDLPRMLNRIYSKKSLHVVLVYGVENDFNLLEAEFNKIQYLFSNYVESDNKSKIWSLIHSVHCVRFDVFHSLYQDCCCIFEGEIVAPVRKGHAKCYPTEIISSFLFLGDYRDGTDVTTLGGLHITHIVDSTGEQISQSVAESLSMHYMDVPIWDLPDTDIAAHFESVLKFIHGARESGGRVLVHCRAGISRSVTFVIAYLLYSNHSSTLGEALRTVLTARPFACPNVSFRHQLRDYELRLKGHASLTSDENMLVLMKSLCPSWEGMFQTETDHDRVPILAGRNPILSAHLEEFPPEGSSSDSVTAAKPKRRFLKRGEGKIRAL